jgi:negative regulator of flagellin synthesis FlgM
MVIDPGSSNANKSHSKGAYAATTTSSKSAQGLPAVTAANLKPQPNITDSVSLSPKAQSLARLEAKIGQAADVDRQKVESVKQAIAEGRYRVDPQKIAQAMLKDEP